MNNKEAVVHVNLGQMPDEVIGLILKRVPAKDLVKACTQVSKQWHRILSANFFWKEKMEEVDGYRLPWQRLAGQSVDYYKRMAIKQPFSRNFIRDSWDLTKQEKDCYQPDGRWERNAPNLRFEVPALFLPPQPEIGPELGGEPVLACLAVPLFIFSRRIVIRLADEGLTNELMDIYRPTIVISELVANHLGYPLESEYRMHYYLSPDGNIRNHLRPEQNRDDIWEGADEHQAEAFRRKGFQQGEVDSWSLMRHEFKQYPAGMRYLILQLGLAQCLKLARCSVMALCESNALKADEAVQSRG